MIVLCLQLYSFLDLKLGKLKLEPLLLVFNNLSSVSGGFSLQGLHSLRHYDLRLISISEIISNWLYLTD